MAFPQRRDTIAGIATQPNIRAYLVGGSAQGPVYYLRGHSAIVARVCLWLGVLLTPAAAFAVHGASQKLQDETGLSIAAAAVLLCAGLIGGALWRLRRPDRKLIIDRDQQTLTVWSYGQARQTLAFADLGPMSLGSRTAMVYRSSGERARVNQAAIGLSRHPEVTLYIPSTQGDMVRFCVTLRHIIGEQYLPKAQPAAPQPA